MLEIGDVDEVINNYNNAININYHYHKAHCNLGFALRERGQLDEAVVAFKNAIAINPDYSDAYNCLGNSLKEQGKLKDAIAAYHRAIQIDPKNKDAFSNLGYALRDQGNLAEAVVAYHHAIEIDPTHKDAYNGLDNVLIDQGKLEDARAAYRQALAIQPDYAAAHFSLKFSKTKTEYNGDIKEMENIYAKSRLSDEQRMYLAFALGKAFEELKQHEKAFSFLLTGNEIKRKTIGYSLASDEKCFIKIKDLFTSNLFAAHQPEKCIDRSPIFVVGMPRSGTTLVEQILATHPEVHGAGELLELD